MTGQLPSALADALARHLGAHPRSARRLHGGDIAAAYVVDLGDGRRVFVKTLPQGAAMFETEARGLEWLHAAGALRIPQVLAVESRPPFLALEYLEPAAAAPDFHERLGRGLADLHRCGAPCFGLDHDNFIGTLPQRNDPASDWSTFYRDRRLAPLVELAHARGLVPPLLRNDFDRLFSILDERCGPSEPPARLHGDLWSGNLLCDSVGQPVLIDPAVYGGHREIDLAMMKLFGGFSARAFDAYQEAYPLAPGAAERVPLYQLYPLLVHVVLFGAGYVASAARAVQSML